MFNTKGQEMKSGGGVQKSLQAGVVYAHIYGGQLKASKTGKKALELHLEGDAPEGFEGWPIDKNNPDGPKYAGPFARVGATMYTDQYDSNSPAKNEIVYKLLFIASELGLRDEADNVNAKTIEEWVEKVINLLKGRNLYFFLKGTEEEYNGKTIVKLALPKFKFASSNEEGLDKFDKNNQYHYKALQTKNVKDFEPAGSDFDLD